MSIDPHRTLEACHIRTTDTIVDFGAGAGFLAHAACDFVPKGTVCAIDINRDIVTRLVRDAHQHHREHFHALWGDIEIVGGSQLADQSCNMVIMSNVLFLLDDKHAAIREAKRILVPGGTILIIDWRESFNHMGPAPHHVFSQSMAEALIAHEKLSSVDTTIPVGDHHYGILCKKV